MNFSSLRQIAREVERPRAREPEERRRRPAAEVERQGNGSLVDRVRDEVGAHLHPGRGQGTVGGPPTGRRDAPNEGENRGQGTVGGPPTGRRDAPEEGENRGQGTVGGPPTGRADAPADGENRGQGTQHGPPTGRQGGAGVIPARMPDAGGGAPVVPAVATGADAAVEPPRRDAPVQLAQARENPEPQGWPRVLPRREPAGEDGRRPDGADRRRDGPRPDVGARPDGGAEAREPARPVPDPRGPAQHEPGPGGQGPGRQGPVQPDPVQQGPVQQGPVQQGPAQQGPAQQGVGAGRAAGPAAGQGQAAPVDNTPLTEAELAQVPGLTEDADTTAATLTTRYANNPRATTAMAGITADPAFQRLTAAQQGGLLARFGQAPNAATAQYVRGMAAYHASAPENRRAGYNSFINARNPDGGSITVGGNTFTVQNGMLQNAEGDVAGNIHTDGTFQMLGETGRRNFYDEERTRVRLTEGQGQQQRTLTDLHDADPGNRLGGANVNPTFRDRARGTLRDMRREGVSMGVTDAYRDYAHQDRLYAQGRTAPGPRVTNAPGGRSWHNYGVAMDATFHNAQGQPHWPQGGEHRQLWQRYGEVGEARNLEWGGRWTNPVDLPHHQMPDLGRPGNQEQTLRNQGLQQVWRNLGIGR